MEMEILLAILRLSLHNSRNKISSKKATKKNEIVIHEIKYYWQCNGNGVNYTHFGCMIDPIIRLIINNCFIDSSVDHITNR